MRIVFEIIEALTILSLAGLITILFHLLKTAQEHIRSLASILFLVQKQQISTMNDVADIMAELYVRANPTDANNGPGNDGDLSIQ